MIGEKIDAFIHEVRTASKFIDAAAIDSTAHHSLAEMERGLHGLDSQAGEDPFLIDVVDEVERVITDARRPLKNRLVEITELFGRLHAAGRKIN